MMQDLKQSWIALKTVKYFFPSKRFTEQDRQFPLHLESKTKPSQFD